jgi:hypothetical protein
MFHFSKTTTTTLLPIQPHIQSVRGSSPRLGKAAGAWGLRLNFILCGGSNEWSYAPPPPIRFQILKKSSFIYYLAMYQTYQRICCILIRLARRGASVAPYRQIQRILGIKCCKISLRSYHHIYSLCHKWQSLCCLYERCSTFVHSSPFRCVFYLLQGKWEQFIWQWGWISTWLIRIIYKMTAFSRNTVPQTLCITTYSKNNESLAVKRFYCRTVLHVTILYQVVISASPFGTRTN